MVQRTSLQHALPFSYGMLSPFASGLLAHGCRNAIFLHCGSHLSVSHFPVVHHHDCFSYLATRLGSEANTAGCCLLAQRTASEEMLGLAQSMLQRPGALRKLQTLGHVHTRLLLTASTAASQDILVGSIREALRCRVQEAAKAAFGDAVSDLKPELKVAARPEDGDYTSAVTHRLAKALGKSAQVVGKEIMHHLNVSDMCSPPTMTKAGFISFQLHTQFIEQRLHRMLTDPARLGIAAVANPSRIVVDFSSPNIAKEMHVGHLRSTIIGDSICRVLEFLGHDVSRVNHVGDWGTQFGMVLCYLKEEVSNMEEWLKNATGEELTDLYRKSKQKFDADPAFQTNARKEVRKLQSGDPETIRIWEQICEASRRDFQTIYDILDVKLQEQGESFYNPLLKPLVDGLLAKGLAEESDGAVCIFIEGFENRQGGRLPLIIRKQDGGYTYATTDLAAIKHRCEVDKASRILYVTDAGQASHFQQIFQAAKLAGLAPPDVSLEHVPFGFVQGEQGQKLKSRSGELIKLKDLLSEAMDAASAGMKLRYEEAGKTFDEAAERDGRKIGIAAVKYADLSTRRTNDYRFSYSKMLALNGNTAPYLLYAYARIMGIRRKDAAPTDAIPDAVHLGSEAEVALAKQLLLLPETLRAVEQHLYPSYLCDYIYDLSGKFTDFYHNCPVHQAETADLKQSRLALCTLTANVLKRNLDMLGIPVLDAM